MQTHYIKTKIFLRTCCLGLPVHVGLQSVYL